MKVKFHEKPLNKKGYTESLHSLLTPRVGLEPTT